MSDMTDSGAIATDRPAAPAEEGRRVSVSVRWRECAIWGETLGYGIRLGGERYGEGRGGCGEKENGRDGGARCLGSAVGGGGHRGGKVGVLQCTLCRDALGGVVNECLRKKVEAVGVETRDGAAEFCLVPLGERRLVVGQAADTRPALLVRCSE
jgi:hypothetical protein